MRGLFTWKYEGKGFRKREWFKKKKKILTHCVTQNKALIPCGCTHAAHGTRPSFHGLYFHCFGKHSQTETGFKTKFLPMKGENSYRILLRCFDVRISKNTMASKRNISFLKHLIYTFQWMMTVSIILMTQTMDGRLILNKLGRRKERLC